jgi:hypothetical protein
MIPLAGAFRWVVAQLERAAHVNADQRLGIRPGDLIQAGAGAAVIATGALFTKEFTTFSARERLRPRSLPPSPPRPVVSFPPAVPLLPDGYMLNTLLADRREHPKSMSDAEMRICQAHEWLMTELGAGRITAVAKLRLRDSDDRIWEDGDGPGLVQKELWEACDVDYGSSSMATRDDQWEAEFDLYRRHGALFLDDIRLNFAQLETRLASLGAPPAYTEASFELQAGGSGDEWKVAWQGESCIIATDGFERRARGMRALAVLLRNPGIKVSHYLLDGLARKPVHTRQKDPKIVKTRDALNDILNPMGQRLFEGRTSIEVLHGELVLGLVKLGVESQRLAAVASWSASYEPDARRGKLSEDGRRVGANVRKSLGDALEEIRKILPGAADDLNGAISGDSYSCQFESARSSVAWVVQTAASKGSGGGTQAGE